MIVLAYIIGIVLLLNLLSLFINQVFFRNELDGLTPYGQMVNVNGTGIHVYSMGQGGNTIVLLPGFSVPLPSADFGPLMRELSKENTVVCVEYPGVGFSGQTDTPRTNENYMQEIRSALSQAGFAPPYVLMPHSGSGIYSEYYATKHPEEVSALVLMDPTSSAQPDANIPRFVYSLGKVQQAIGLGRIFNPLVVSKVLSINVENGYTQREIDDYTKFMNHYVNDTYIDQVSRLNENIEELRGMEFPAEVPVLLLIAEDTQKQMGEAYYANHLQRLGANAQSAVLTGSHFIYHMQLAEITALANRFLENV